jgi:hypothetical protein
VAESALGAGVGQPLVHAYKGLMAGGYVCGSRLDLAEHGSLLGRQGHSAASLWIVNEPPHNEMLVLECPLDVAVFTSGQSNRRRRKAPRAE